MKLEMMPSDSFDKNSKFFPQGSVVRCYSKLFKQKYNFSDQQLSLFWKNSHFFIDFP